MRKRGMIHITENKELSTGSMYIQTPGFGERYSKTGKTMSLQMKRLTRNTPPFSRQHCIIFRMGLEEEEQTVDKKMTLGQVHRGIFIATKRVESKLVSGERKDRKEEFL
jgi:hypothetical protein